MERVGPPCSAFVPSRATSAPMVPHFVRTMNARNTLGSNGTFFAFFVMTDPLRSVQVRICSLWLTALTRREDYFSRTRSGGGTPRCTKRWPGQHQEQPRRGGPSWPALDPSLRASFLRAFMRRQDQLHGRTPAIALPLELASELLGEAFHQPAAEPGIGARIGPLAVVRDRQAKLPRRPL
jgi:hypothetical protein